MEPKIPYWHSSRFLGAFVYKDGENGCVICTEGQDMVSIDRTPPPLRNKITAPKPKNDPMDALKEISDPWMNIFIATGKAVQAVRKVKDWAATPLPPAPLEIALPDATAGKYARLFDIQDIPDVIKRLGAPNGAAMLKKWFEGESNYSLTNEDAKAGLNQKCQPYPAAMIDKKSLTMKWVLSYKRAEDAYEELLHKSLETPHARCAIKKCLASFTSRPLVNSYEECCGDIARIHKEFQFQLCAVEGDLPQKLMQYLNRTVADRGIPDDLTFALGAFNIYAAIGNATFRKVQGGTFAKVNTVYIYIKDSFDFTDGGSANSQYLGHWSDAGVALVPLAAMNIGTWAKAPILPKKLMNKESPMFPVRNVDFRNWRQKHGRGGDFIIYTDALCRWVDKPIEVFIPN